MKTSNKNFSSVQAQRLRHYQGERLIGKDLQDEYDNLAWLRSLHVVALHNTWGIALGLEVTLVEGKIWISPGLAYDCFGREILLSTAREVALPPELAQAPDGYDLVMRYDGDLGEQQRGIGVALCPPACERPALAWQQPAQIRLGRDVPLVHVLLVDELPALDLDARRYTQPLARPHIGRGHIPSNQPWVLWRYQDVLFLQTDVDTTDAGFVGTPYYITTLSCHLPAHQGTVPQSGTNAVQDATAFARLAMAQSSQTAVTPATIPYLFTGIAVPLYDYNSHVLVAPDPRLPYLPMPPSATGFTFRITMAPTREQLANSLFENLLHTREAVSQVLPIPFLSVAWMGVEPGGGCSRRPAGLGVLRDSCADCTGR